MESEKLVYLKKQIDDRVKSINSKRIYYRRTAFWSFISISILAALSTVILGLSLEKLGEIPRIIALIITSVISIISAYNSFFDNKNLWVVNNTALNEFYKLRFDIEYAEQEEAGVNDELVDEFKKEYQNILDTLNKTWSETRSA